MPLYVAGKFRDREEIHKHILKLQEKGWQITHDWTQQETQDKSTTSLGENAQADIQGVADAEYFIADMTDTKYAYGGTWTELGAALALGKMIHIICPLPYYEPPSVNQLAFHHLHPSLNCFFWHKGITHHNSWDELYSKLLLL